MIRKFHVLLLPIFLSFAVNAASAIGRDMTVEAAIEKQLEQIDPNLVDPFRKARIAWDEEKPAEAEKLLRVVTDNAPQFDPALRRRAGGPH